MLAEIFHVHVNLLNKSTILSSGLCSSDLKSMVQFSLAAVMLCVLVLS